MIRDCRAAEHGGARRSARAGAPDCRGRDGKAPDRSRPLPGDLSQFAGLFAGRGRGRPIAVRIQATGRDISLTDTAPGASTEILQYDGNDTFGFKDTLVTFEKENGTVSKLRLDTGGGYNILSRQSGSQK